MAKNTIVSPQNILRQSKCIICGRLGELEPRFGYYVCKLHESVRPNSIKQCENFVIVNNNIDEFVGQISALLNIERPWWWGKIEPFVIGQWMGDCEDCDRHLLSEGTALWLNKFLDSIRKVAPPPYAIYGHCGDSVFIEWSDDEQDIRICLDSQDKMALVSSKNWETYFIKLIETN